MPEVSVRAAWELLLPAGTQLVGGEAGLDRKVTWPVVLRTHAPAFDVLRGGELAIVPLDRLHFLDATLTLRRVVTDLSRARVSAVCVIGSIEPGDTAAADATATPLLQLPEGTNPAEVHQSFLSGLAEHRVELARRIREVGLELSGMALAGQERAAVVKRLAQVADAVTAIVDVGGRVETLHVPLSAALERADAVRIVERLVELDARPLGRAAANGAVGRVASDGHGAALMTQLKGRHFQAGHLVLMTLGREPGAWEEAILEQAAVACHIDLAREEAATAARDGVETGLFEELVAGSFQSADALERRARNLGYDLTRPHVVLALSPPSPPADIAATVDGGPGAGSPLALHTRDEVAYLFVPIDAARADPNGVAAGLLRGSEDRRSIGIGGIASGAAELARAAQRAAHALAVGTRLFGPGRATSIDDIGLHGLLFELRDQPALTAFRQTMLGTLIDHDSRTGSELVETLDAYLASSCSPSAAASRLHLHRNGLLYRVKRIRELVPVNLDDAEDRLGLHVALRIGDVLRGG